MENKKIGVKDLINVGIFAVVYTVVFMISAMTGVIPVMAVYFPVVALLGALLGKATLKKHFKRAGIV